MLLLSESIWNGIACALGLWGCTGCIGWKCNPILEIMYWARGFYAAGIQSHAKAIARGIGLVLGYVLADLATTKYGHAWGCLPTSIMLLPTCFGLLEGVYWGTRSTECDSFNPNLSKPNMAATVGDVHCRGRFSSWTSTELVLIMVLYRVMGLLSIMWMEKWWLAAKLLSLL